MPGIAPGHEAGAAENPRSGSHDRIALVTKVYGEHMVFASSVSWENEYVDNHAEWLETTKEWSYDEIRDVLHQEAEDEFFLVAGWPIAGWCRCPDHGDLIEGFLAEYGLRFEDGDVRDDEN